MDFSEFCRVNEIFDFTFKFLGYRAFIKLLDIHMIYEQFYCAKHFVILNICIFKHSLSYYLDISFFIAKYVVCYKRW